MDLLLQLAPLKQMSLAYVYNNKKINNIVSIQQKKEKIFETVDSIRSKLIAWRKFKTVDFDQDKEQSLDNYKE